MQMARVQLSTARVQPCKIYSCFPPRKAACSEEWAGDMLPTGCYESVFAGTAMPGRNRGQRQRERGGGERSVGKARKRLLYEFFLVFFRLTSNELEVSHVQSRPLDVRSCAARCTKMQEAEKERGYSKSN